MSMFKKLSLILSALIVMSCDRVDKVSPLGSDVIGKIDSSAIEYDGVFHSEDLTATGGDWVSITDAISGLHRYKDSLSNRNGNIQSEVVLGRFSTEEAFGYTTFYPTIDIDTTISNIETTFDTTFSVHSVSWYVDSLLKAGKDSVSTSMTLFIDTTKQSLDLYNLELSTLPFVLDSTAPDTSAREVLQSVLIPRGERRHTFSLPYNYHKKDGETVEDYLELSGLEVTSYTKTIVSRKKMWKNGSIADSSVPVPADTVVVSAVDSFPFSASSVYPYYAFCDFDSTIEATLILDKPLGVSEEHFIDTAKIKLDPSTKNPDSTKAVVKHSFLSGPVKISDSLYIPMDETVNSSDTIVEIFAAGATYDSIYHISDTTFVYTEKTVTQKGEVIDKIIDISPRSSDKFDTLNILMKNITSSDNSLLHLTGRPWLRVIGHKKDAADDTISILPQRTSMSVFDKGTPISPMDVTASGGMEVFTRLNLNSANFWKLMNTERYLSIVSAAVEVPVESVEFAHKDDDQISLRAMFYQKNLTNGALLADSSIYESKSVVYNADSSSVKIDVTDYLINLRYGITTTVTPPTYLYLWIDGSKMGRITFDRNSPYRFSYIIQNKAN